MQGDLDEHLRPLTADRAAQLLPRMGSERPHLLQAQANGWPPQFAFAVAAGVPDPVAGLLPAAHPVGTRLLVRWRGVTLYPAALGRDRRRYYLSERVRKTVALRAVRCRVSQSVGQRPSTGLRILSKSAFALIVACELLRVPEPISLIYELALSEPFERCL